MAWFPGMYYLFPFLLLFLKTGLNIILKINVSCSCLHSGQFGDFLSTEGASQVVEDSTDEQVTGTPLPSPGLGTQPPDTFHLSSGTSLTFLLNRGPCLQHWPPNLKYSGDNC